ncbi:14882_t:CDS:1 [Funneliformis geosporum]|uniref:14595_t:CDS:1 n=1 Tax=Funneliformis geosporum TaxID=1117311 RepID=A0A9W4WNE8_9GLOM|nr:14595_t:CDS:1 [Funneliformis geosporum]CAI2174938.1 14882_t:CDS:1 [Funneliformis geosporum]
MVKAQNYETFVFRLEINNNAGNNVALPQRPDPDNVIQFETDSNQNDEEIVRKFNLDLDLINNSTTTRTAIKNKKKNIKHIPRCQNSFILYRKVKNKDPRFSGKVTDACVEISTMWKNESEEVVNVYKAYARLAKKEFSRKHKNYKYQPKRLHNKKKQKRQTKKNKSSSSSATSPTPDKITMRNESNTLDMQSTSPLISSTSFSSTSPTPDKNNEPNTDMQSTSPSISSSSFSTSSSPIPYNNNFQNMRNESSMFGMQLIFPSNSNSSSSSTSSPFLDNTMSIKDASYLPQYLDFECYDYPTLGNYSPQTFQVASNSLTDNQYTTNGSETFVSETTSPSIPQLTYPTPVYDHFEPDTFSNFPGSSQPLQNATYPTPVEINSESNLPDLQPVEYFSPLRLIKLNNEHNEPEFSLQTNPAITPNSAEFVHDFTQDEVLQKIYRTLSIQDQMSMQPKWD